MRLRRSGGRPTPAGGAMVFVLGAALIVLLVGPHHDETPALVVIAVVLAIFVVGLVQRGGGA